jgi:hypothetical protein
MVSQNTEPKQFHVCMLIGVCGSVVGRGTTLQAGRLWVQVLMRIFFNLPNRSSCTMPLGSIQPLTEMSAMNLPVGLKGGWCVR